MTIVWTGCSPPSCSRSSGRRSRRRCRPRSASRSAGSDRRVHPAPEAAGRRWLLVVIGGVASSLGAETCAVRRPNPFPRVLGYHEIFHILTLVAAGCMYAAVAFYVLPRG